MTFDPSSALRGAGGDEGAGRGALMVGRGPEGTGFLRGNTAAPGGSPRVTLKVPFITVSMTPGLSCGDTNRKEGWRFTTSLATASSAEQGGHASGVLKGRNQLFYREPWTQSKRMTHLRSEE